MGTAPVESTGAATIDDETVRSLLAAQCPEYADRELGRVYHHHEHTAVRIGEDLGILLPNFAWQAELFDRAPAILEPLVDRWDFPVSVPVFLGKPSDKFPFPWHIVRWYEAATCANVPLDDAGGAALAAALAQVHTVAPQDAPRGIHSSVTLREHVPEWEELLDVVALRAGPNGERVDVDAINDAFSATVEVPLDGPFRWTHGNLSPLSVLSDRGAFAGLCDWTMVAAGDPAADLGAASTLMSRAALEALPRAYGRAATAALIERSRGYRLLYALRFIATNNPFFTRYGWERLADVDAPATEAKSRRR